MAAPHGDDLTRALLVRARRAVGEARAQVDRARNTRAATKLLGERALLRRCAWCGCVSFGRGWRDVADLPGFVPEQVRKDASHGICESCFQRLQDEGASHQG